MQLPLLIGYGTQDYPENVARRLRVFNVTAWCGSLAAAEITPDDGERVPIRIGLACGPVVAGVAGTRRFFYDVWGDAVNIASRMESTGIPNRIQVTQEVHERLRTRFGFEARGSIEVKGKGLMWTWFLLEPSVENA